MKKVIVGFALVGLGVIAGRLIAPRKVELNEVNFATIDYDKNHLQVCDRFLANAFDPVLKGSNDRSFGHSSVLYNSLFYMPAGTTQAMIHPLGLAESFSFSPDGLTLTVQLKPNVKFHTTPWFTPTRTLTSDDVVFTFMRALDSKNPFYAILDKKYDGFRDLNLDSLKEVRKKDTLTVEFILKEKNYSLLQSLASLYTGIVSAEYANQLVQANAVQNITYQPVGTGPFSLVSVKDSQVEFKRFDSFFVEPLKPNFELMTYKSYENLEDLANKIRRHECQITYSTTETIKDELHIKGLKSTTVKALTTSYFIFNNQTVQKPKLRIALYSIYSLINKEATNFTMISEGQWGYTRLPIVHQLPVAIIQQYIKESGYDGKPLVFISYRNIKRELVQLLVETYKQFGVNIDFKILPFKDWSNYARVGNFDMMDGFGWSSDNGDPDNHFSLWTCDKIDSQNYARFCNKDYDNLVNKARQEPSVYNRAYQYILLQKMMYDQFPFFVNDSGSKITVLHNPYIQNYQLNGLGIVNGYYGVKIN